MGALQFHENSGNHVFFVSVFFFLTTVGGWKDKAALITNVQADRQTDGWMDTQTHGHAVVAIMEQDIEEKEKI